MSEQKEKEIYHPTLDYTLFSKSLHEQVLFHLIYVHLVNFRASEAKVYIAVVGETLAET